VPVLRAEVADETVLALLRRLAFGARSALAAGKTLIHSDSTEYSRPILERSGLFGV